MKAFFLLKISLCSEMASELRFAFKCSSSGKQRNQRAAQEGSSPNNVSDISDRFHPLGPPYAQYEFDSNKGHGMP
jgi:hypothetical protein